jgi:uncharacterized damage-inducible protein DinB
MRGSKCHPHVFFSARRMNNSSPIQTAIAANITVVEQGVRLLGAISDASYRQRNPLCYNASAGGHIRHIIEHYQAFFRALNEAELDYENRVRDPLVENNRDHACELLESIVQRLGDLGPSLVNRIVLYRAETTECIATETSLLRELEFLLSHTIHHYALVAVMARLQGYEPEPTFGVAPSTLKFQRSQPACAR